MHELGGHSEGRRIVYHAGVDEHFLQPQQSRRSAVRLDFNNGNSIHLGMSLYIIVADDFALHSMFGCNGVGGVKPCLLCQNIFHFKNERGISEGDQGGWVQTHAFTDNSKIVLRALESITAVINRLQRAVAVESKAKVL